MENLPVEILQPIFFLADHNIALLQASHQIAAKLSSEYVYKPACRYYLTGVLEDRAAQTAAQTVIFASKWMTWSFFKKWISDFYGPIGCLCGMTIQGGCFDPQWPPDFEHATRMVFSRSHLPRIAFIKARIPKKLLCGPWSSSKVQFLEFLLWMTSMTVDWHDPETRQVAIDGRMQAFRDGNLEAVELFNHNRRLGRNATLSHVRYAVLKGGCNRSIVYDTMLAASTWGNATSWECSELDNWCESQISSGDPKGRWLKTKLEELRVTSHPGKEYQGSDIGYKRMPGGELNSEIGNYDGGVDDQLIINQLKWNQDLNLVTPGWHPYRQGQRQAEAELALLKGRDVPISAFHRLRDGCHQTVWWDLQVPVSRDDISFPKNAVGNWLPVRISKEDMASRMRFLSMNRGHIVELRARLEALRHRRRFLGA